VSTFWSSYNVALNFYEVASKSFEIAQSFETPMTKYLFRKDYKPWQFSIKQDVFPMNP